MISHQEDVQEIVRRQANRVQDRWRTLRDGDLASRYRAGVAAALVAAITTGQVEAAALAAPFVAAELAADPLADRPPSVVPAAFGAVTASGIPLPRSPTTCCSGCSSTCVAARPPRTP